MPTVSIDRPFRFRIRCCPVNQLGGVAMKKKWYTKRFNQYNEACLLAMIAVDWINRN